MTQQVTHNDLANAIRFLSIDAVEAANSGHPGMPMGMADVATVLFTKFLKFDAKNPKWPDRDRFVLSAGHGSMLLYSLFYLTGYEDCDIEQIKNFRKLGYKTAGHPEYGMLEGTETTTGPLGQGLATAVGMALAERMLAARFGEKIVDHHTYVIAGDGDLMEGISHEAASFAGHLGLNKLIVLFDDNGISIDGSTSLAVSDNHLMRFESYGWNTIKIDGHNPKEIEEAIAKAKKSDKPTFIACKTTIAYGCPSKAGSEKSHGSPLGAEEIKGARANLGWNHAPFEIPQDILSEWRKASNSGREQHNEWKKALDKTDKSTKDEFERVISGVLPFPWAEQISQLKQKFANEKPKMATRKSSQVVLEALTAKIPEMIGGSADLSGSNGTYFKELKSVTKQDFSGRYIHYGVREHAMGAIMNGMALHGGFVPYSGTFLVFTDYCKPSIRLSAIMKQRVIYVMTHDSIGLGEDGPTHQPIEHLASLRAIPNLHVFRPADATEVAECWSMAVSDMDTPSVMVLTRQDLPALRVEFTRENLSARGGYILKEASGGSPKVVLIATGSEVAIAEEARLKLEAEGIATRLVSIPSFDLLEQQGDVYKRNLFGEQTLKIAIEAASPLGWDRYIGKYGVFIGMRTFGESGDAKELYKHFGITAEAIYQTAIDRIS